MLDIISDNLNLFVIHVKNIYTKAINIKLKINLLIPIVNKLFSFKSSTENAIKVTENKILKIVKYLEYFSFIVKGKAINAPKIIVEIIPKIKGNIQKLLA